MYTCPSCGGFSQFNNGRCMSCGSHWPGGLANPTVTKDNPLYSIDVLMKGNVLNSLLTTIKLNILDILEEYDRATMKTKYTILVESPFVLTEQDVKNRLGIGFKVLKVDDDQPARATARAEWEDAQLPKDLNTIGISAAIIRSGYRALVRSAENQGNHEIMIAINKTKKELEDLLRSLK